MMRNTPQPDIAIAYVLPMHQCALLALPEVGRKGPRRFRVTIAPADLSR